MASITSLQRDLRLKNEYRALCRLPINSEYSWELEYPEQGERCRSYLVTYYDTAPVPAPALSIPGLTPKRVTGLERQESITLRFDLGPGYPDTAPAASIVRGRKPFLPNVFESGSICFGNLYRPGLFLWQWFNIVGQLLLGDPEVTGYLGNREGQLPANSEADEFYRAHRSMFPVRKASFPTTPEY